MPAMNYYDQNAPRGASFVPSGSQGDLNEEGAAADPFAYTQGSLLTPWQGRFNSSGYGGGYSAPAFTPHNYADFSYQAPDVGQFGETYQDPAAFRFADFAGPSDFRAPTAEDMQADPGYQVRMNAVKNAQVAGAAHGGVLRSGGFQKGLAQAVGDQASQEYNSVYNRRASEHDRLRKEGESNYGINQGNTFQAFNANTDNRLKGYQTRQGTWQANADTALRQGELGFNVAQGTWDRNYAKSRTGWQDQAQHDAQVASANAATAGMNYERDLQDYNRARDEFWTNQDRQNAIRTDERNFGYQVTRDYGNALMGNAGSQADYAMGGANANAAATQQRGAAYGDMAAGIGNGIANAAMAGYGYGGGGYGGQAPRPGASAGAYTPGGGRGYAQTRNTGITGTMSPNYFS